LVTSLHTSSKREENITQYFNNLRYKQSLSPFGGGQRERISKFGNLPSYLLQEGR
jgi:hypothetical protein